jgi:hypothetical protein
MLERFVNIWKEPGAYFHGSELSTREKQNLRVNKNNLKPEWEKVCVDHTIKYVSLLERIVCY